METIASTDVLIVGGGPAGLAVAAEISKRHSCIVVHQDARVGHPVRTSGASWLPDVKDLGIPRDCYHELKKLSFVGPSERADFIFQSDNPVVLDVTRTYRHLESVALNEGADIRCATKFLSLSEEGNSGYVSIVRHHQREYSIRSKFVVDASGHWRSVLGSTGHVSRSTRYGVGREVDISMHPRDVDTAVLFVGNQFCPAGYGWIFPESGDSGRLGIGVIHPDTSTSPKQLLDDFVQSGELERFGIETAPTGAFRGGIIPAAYPIRKFAHDGIFAVGDSAGHAVPLVGEGIRLSIQSGRELGRLMSRHLGGSLGVSDVGSKYERWWNARYRKRFNIGQSINIRISKYDDARWDRGVRFLGRLDAELVRKLLRLDFGFRDFLKTIAVKPSLLYKFPTGAIKELK